MTALILFVAFATAVVIAGLMSPSACFERALEDLDALLDARTNPTRWLR